MTDHRTDLIYIVDDDPFWTGVLTEMLNILGYENIVAFNNGPECIQYLHMQPSLVFLDYQMQGMNGLQVLEKIKRYDPALRVIFFSAHNNMKVAVHAMKEGSFDYLLKNNCNLHELETVIQQMNQTVPVEQKIY